MFRRLFSLVMLCLIGFIGWYALHTLFIPDADQQSRIHKEKMAVLKSQQVGSDKDNLSITYDLTPPEGSPLPAMHLQVKFPRTSLSRADRFHDAVNASVKNQLVSEMSTITSQLFEERQRRIQQIQQYINTQIAGNPEQATLNIDENGVAVSIYRPHEAQKAGAQNTAQAQQVEDWIHATVAQYEPYILGIAEDPNWTSPRTIGINKVLSPHLYMLDGTSDPTSIQMLPNYTWISQRAQNVVYPLAQALYQQSPAKDARSLAQFALTFIQAMPTTHLQPRALTGPAMTSFSTPADCMLENQCDPDAKVVLLGSLLAILAPQTPVVIAQTEYNAYLGIALPAKQTDEIYTIEGTPFVLADPSSIDFLPLGTVKLQPKSNPRARKFLKVTVLNGS